MIRALIAAASDVGRAGLESLVGRMTDVEIAGRAGDADALSALIRSTAPDVVLIDAGSRSASGEIFLKMIGDVPRGLGVVALIDDASDASAAEGRRSEGFALLPQRATAAEVDAAIRAVAAGLLVTHPDLVDRPAQAPAAHATADGSLLTPREVEVLRMLADGLPNKSIAKRLGVSAHTIKFHVGSIMTKLHASSRTEAVTDGIRRGLIFV